MKKFFLISVAVVIFCAAAAFIVVGIRHNAFSPYPPNGEIDFYLRGNRIFSCFPESRVFDRRSKTAFVAKISKKNAFLLMSALAENNVKRGDALHVRFFDEIVSFGVACFNSEDLEHPLSLIFPPQFVFMRMEKEKRDALFKKHELYLVGGPTPLGWTPYSGMGEDEWGYASFSSFVAYSRKKTLKCFLEDSDISFKEAVSQQQWSEEDIEAVLAGYLLSMKIPFNGFLFFEPINPAYRNHPFFGQMISDLEESCAYRNMEAYKKNAEK